jgi:hypothetical protein
MPNIAILGRIPPDRLIGNVQLGATKWNLAQVVALAPLAAHTSSVPAEIHTQWEQRSYTATSSGRAKPCQSESKLARSLHCGLR